MSETTITRQERAHVLATQGAASVSTAAGPVVAEPVPLVVGPTHEVPVDHAIPPRGFWPWVRATLPTLVVIVMLAGLAAWGHEHEWKLPKFSSLLGQSAAPEPEWCDEHNVAEEECIECQRKLVPLGKNLGWCKEHGIAPCTLHHPEVAQLNKPPRVSAGDLERVRQALDLLPREKNNSRCRLHERRIQFASVEAMDKAGVDIAVARQRPILEAIVANGEVHYNENQVAHLASRVGGTVWRVEKQVGDVVHVGDVLVLIESVEVGRAKSEFLQSIGQARLKQATADRLKPLVSEAVVSRRQFQEADAALEESRIHVRSAQQTLINMGLPVEADDLTDLTTKQIAERIQFLGVPDRIADELGGAQTTSNLIPLRASLDGVVVERHVVPGEVVDTRTTAFSVVDLSKMWLTLDVRQEEIKYVRIGQEVLFRPSDNPDEADLPGSVAWISTEADHQTRTVKVRVDLPNDAGTLKANTFGTARIVLRREPQAVVVPSQAVHWDGCCHVVFVRDRDFLKSEHKFFHVRKVRIGVKEGDTTEILAGLFPREVVANKNSVVLAAQLNKSRLGDSCDCAH